MSLAPIKPARAAASTAASPAVAGHRPLSIALALAACFAATPLRAQPAGAQAVHGTAVLQQNGANLTVTTQNGAGTGHSAINWQSFNVPGGSTTHFAQPNAASTSINRVLGNNPSAIFGTLSSNGKLVLVNPSGIAVGAGAVVDTAGFTASTLRMSDADALAGRMRFGQDGLGGGSLSVQGRVVARGGDVVLIAPQIETGAQAVVQASGGDTLLVAGQKVALTGRGLEGIQLELQAPADRALNLGTLKGDSVAVFASQLRHTGLVQAQTASVEGGKVLLRGQVSADVTGRVTAQREGGARGGAIHVTAAQTALHSTAVLDASGPAGGGEVLVGGGWQGRGPLANAQNTTADAGSVIRADATASGDGGTVVVWSDGTTRTAAGITARGGAQGGNGGRVETSGKTLVRRGMPDVSAPRGQAGTWLLDPDYILITQGYGGEPGNLGGGSIAAGDAGSVTQVLEGEIESFNGNIVLEANHAIVAEGESNFDLYVNGNLTLRTLNATAAAGPVPSSFTDAPRGIDLSRIDTLVVSASNGPARQVLMDAGSTAPTPVSDVKLKVNNIVTSSQSYSAGQGGGSVNLLSAGDLWVGNIHTNHYGTVAGSGGNVTIEAKNGHVRVGVINTTTDNSRVSYGSLAAGLKAGDIAINGKTVQLTGNLTADGYADRSQGSAPGSITIKSGWGCGGECTGLDTLTIGEEPMEPGSAMLPMNYDGPSPITISARSGHASLTGEPVAGGTVVLEALAGNIRMDGQTVQIQADGELHDLAGNTLTSSNGGTVRVKALAGSITAASLSIDVSGGDAGTENGDGIPAGRNGGHGGTVELSAGTGFSIEMLEAKAFGGTGGGLRTQPMMPHSEGPPAPAVQAGQGGSGGSIALSTTSGSLLSGTQSAELLAHGGAGGGTQNELVLSEGTMGAGGAGGAITLKAPTLSLPASVLLGASVAGGAGGEDEYGGLPQGTGGAGGVINLETTSASGRIQLSGSQQGLNALGASPAQPYTGTVHLRAGSGGIVVGSGAVLHTGSLHLDSPLAHANTLGNVSILGDNDIREVYGPVTNPSVYQGPSMGSGPARLTLESNAQALRLGGGNSQALTVAGDISITLLAAEGREEGGTLVIADTVQSQNGTISLYTNKLKLASGASHEKLVATNHDRGAVQIISDRVIRFSPQAHASDPDSENEIILNSDEIARMDTPVLRVHNYLYSAPDSESVVFGASAGAPARTTDAPPAPAPVDRVMFNGPGALSPGKTVSIETNLKVAQTEPFSVDRMHISAGAVDLQLANLFGPDTAGGRGWFSADVGGFGESLYSGEQASVRLRNAALGTLELSAQDAGTGGFNYNERGVYAVSNLSGGEVGSVPLVHIAAVDDEGTPRGNIEIGQPGIESGKIQLKAQHIYNKGIAGAPLGGVLRTVAGDGPNTVAAGEDSIVLDAAGNIGKAEPDGYISVAPLDGTRVHAHAGTSGAFESSQMALYFGQDTAPTLLTSLLDLEVGGGQGEVHIKSANAITVDSVFAPAEGVVALYTGQRGDPEAPHDDGVITVSGTGLLGGLAGEGGAGTGTVRLEGASVYLGAYASVQARDAVEIEALGVNAESGNIHLAPTAWLVSEGVVALHAQGSILGSTHEASLGTQIEAPKVILGARKSVAAHVDAAEIVAGDSPTNSTGGSDTIDLVLTGAQATRIRGAGNADGDIRIWGPFSSLIQVSGNLLDGMEGSGGMNRGGVVGKSVYISSGGDLHIGHRVKATDAEGSGIELYAGDVIKIGHFDNYSDDVHVMSQANIHAAAQSIYLYHTAGTPTGTPRETPALPSLPSVYLRAEGTLLATAYSSETFEVNATNTGGVGTVAGGGMNINSPTIKFVGGNGPNQFALATSPALNFSTTPVYTPGTGLNSFAASGAAPPPFVQPPPPPAGSPPVTPPTAPPVTPPVSPPVSPPVTPPVAPPPAPVPPAQPPVAPSPAATPAVERIVEVLRNDTSVTRADVAAIVAEIDNNVTRFVTLLIKEEAKQAEDRRKEEEKKESIALINPDQCK